LYGVRFQQLPRALTPVAFNFSSWLAGVPSGGPSNVSETTIDFNSGLAFAQARRLHWRSTGAAAESTAHVAAIAASKLSAKISPTEVDFDSELVRSFVFSISA
jgi:hypothetical protein